MIEKLKDFLGINRYYVETTYHPEEPPLKSGSFRRRDAEDVAGKLTLLRPEWKHRAVKIAK